MVRAGLEVHRELGNRLEREVSVHRRDGRVDTDRAPDCETCQLHRGRGRARVQCERRPGPAPDHDPRVRVARHRHTDETEGKRSVRHDILGVGALAGKNTDGHARLNGRVHRCLYRREIWIVR